jgi:hypothetical protein
MHKMGVGGYGIDFASDFPELFILFCQILQFCGAYKGKIRRIKEKQTPFAQNIIPGNHLKGPIMKGICTKVRNLLVDH